MPFRDVRFRRKKSGNLSSVDFNKRSILFIEDASEWRDLQRRGTVLKAVPFITKHEAEHQAVVKTRSMKASEQLDSDPIYRFINQDFLRRKPL